MMEFDKELQNAIDTILKDDSKTILDRGDILIKDCCRLINDLMDYRYAAEHYKGDMDAILKEKQSTIKNTLGIFMSNSWLYMENIKIYKAVNNKGKQRMTKLLKMFENRKF